MRLTQGQFSFLPDLTDEEITMQIDYGLSKGYAVERRIHRRPASRAIPTGRCSASRCSTCRTPPAC